MTYLLLEVETEMLEDDDASEDDVVGIEALVEDDEELVLLIVLDVTVVHCLGGEMPLREFLITSKYGVPQSQSFRALVASQSMTPPN